MILPEAEARGANKELTVNANQIQQTKTKDKKEIRWTSDRNPKIQEIETSNRMENYRK